MIVRQFLYWVRNAPAAERAEATAALARSYLYSDLTPDDRAAAEGALIMQLDDPSPRVRTELARAGVQRAIAAGGDPRPGRRPAGGGLLGAARRRPSRSRRLRPATRSGRSSVTCAKAGSSMPGWS